MLLRREDDPLADDAIAGDVLLDGVGPVRLLVALDEGGGRFLVVEARRAEDAGTGREHARADDVAGLDEVRVGEYIVGRRLRIARRRHAVGEVGEYCHTCV